MFDWDPQKNRQNLAKHGVDFDVAKEIFEHEYIEDIDDSMSYEEERYIALGRIGDKHYVVVYTMRDGRRRIISARKAKRQEIHGYYSQNP